jgi:histidine triad (HIT) family protein
MANMKGKTVSSTCPFCSIVSGKAEASTVYEDETVMAFMDLLPAREGHTLVVPKQHFENIYEIPEDVLAKVVAGVKRVSVALKKTFGADGVKIIQLNGKAAGQVVFHIHFHVIPIVSAKGSEIGHLGREQTKRDELDLVAKRIRENF